MTPTDARNAEGDSIMEILRHWWHGEARLGLPATEMAVSLTKHLERDGFQIRALSTQPAPDGTQRCGHVLESIPDEGYEDGLICKKCGGSFTKDYFDTASAPATQPLTATGEAGLREILAQRIERTMPDTAARLRKASCATVEDEIIPIGHALAAMRRVSAPAVTDDLVERYLKTRDSEAITWGVTRISVNTAQTDRAGELTQHPSFDAAMAYRDREITRAALTAALSQSPLHTTKEKP